MAKSKCKRAPKTVLKLPDLEQSKSAVLNSLASASSKRSYDHAIREFIDWYCSEPRLAFNRTVVTRYRIALEQHPYAPSTINLRLAAIRRLAYEASDCGLLSPDLAAGVRRVKGVRRLGVRVGNWLTAEEGKKLLGTENADTLRSRRNGVLLSVLIGCGLRRAQVTILRFEDFQLREGHWVISDLRGKGGAASKPFPFRSGSRKQSTSGPLMLVSTQVRCCGPSTRRAELGDTALRQGDLGNCKG